VQSIGLYGGTFDPVHNGHLLVGLAALDELGLSRLYYIPAARSPFKTDCPPASPEQRLAMLRLALAGQTRCEVESSEIDRGGTSFTIDTVRAFTSRFPTATLYYLIGADNVAMLSSWQEAAELARRVEFVVVPRPGEPLQPLPPPFRGRQLRGFPFNVSSSEIRNRVKTGQSLTALVPALVAEFIQNNRLYL